MNLLTEVKVKGEVFCEYAFLSFDFMFQNKTETAVSAEYSFKLPENAVISDMKIIDAEGKVIKASVVSLTHASAIWNSSNSAILRRIDTTEYKLNLGSITRGGCHIVLSVYAALKKSGNKYNFHIPLCGDCAEVELLVRGAELDDVISSTHEITKVKKTEGVYTTTGRFNADTEFSITVFNSERTNSAIVVQDGFGGEMLCRLYPDNSLVIADGGKLKVLCDAAETVVISGPTEEDSGITLYVRYVGDMPPRGFEIEYMGRRMHMSLDRGEVYKSFAPIGLVCAEHLYSVLCRRLSVCAADEVWEIRAEMERIGVKFSAVNSETALVAVVDGGRPETVRVVIPEPLRDMPVELYGSDMFNENDALLTLNMSKAILDMYTDVIVVSMRSNGGIFTGGELNPNLQKQQTLICLLALVSAGRIESMAAFAERAAVFLNGYSYRGMSFTKDRAEADKILEAVFGKVAAVFQPRPDLLTAARLLWQVERQTRGHFC